MHRCPRIVYPTEIGVIRLELIHHRDVFVIRRVNIPGEDITGTGCHLRFGNGARVRQDRVRVAELFEIGELFVVGVGKDGIAADIVNRDKTGKFGKLVMRGENKAKIIFRSVHRQGGKEPDGSDYKKK